MVKCDVCGGDMENGLSYFVEHQGSIFEYGFQVWALNQRTDKAAPKDICDRCKEAIVRRGLAHLNEKR